METLRMSSTKIELTILVAFWAGAASMWIAVYGPAYARRWQRRRAKLRDAKRVLAQHGRGA